MLRKILIITGVILGMWAVWHYELIIYGISQAKGQLKIVIESRNIKEVLQDPLVPDSLKQKINLVQEIRAFAIDSLGLNNSDSYRTLYDQKGKPVLWVVTACEPFSLKDKTWHFPVLGTFSYKGFFDYPKAITEKEELASKGYDTGIRTVSAWSTLGFLNDPIMSDLLFRDVGNVANTVIHELTHGTIFVKNNLKFNENLASFIGDEGAIRFLACKYGKDSPEYTYYKTYMADRKRYVDHILRGMQRLDSLYSTFTADMSKDTKTSRKHNVIRDIILDTDTIYFENQHYLEAAKKLQHKDTLPNNTFFKSYVRYQSEVEEFEKIYEKQFNSNLKAFLNYLKQEYPSL